MGGAIANGLVSDPDFTDEITVIDVSKDKEKNFTGKNIHFLVNDYTTINDADLIIIGVKPWLVKDVLIEHKHKLRKNQLIISIAAGITLDNLTLWTNPETPVFRLIPNTAIAVRQSMTFVCAENASKEQEKMVIDIFNRLGKAIMLDEKSFSAATALSSCGIAYAFRYIRAAMEGGVEMGLYPDMAKDIVLQTLKGAVELLEANQSHPEVEIDKVTTAGGITIKGLNEMEHAGFTSAVIRGLKASNIG